MKDLPRGFVPLLLKTANTANRANGRFGRRQVHWQLNFASFQPVGRIPSRGVRMAR